MTRRVLLAMAAFALVATACGTGNESAVAAEVVAAPVVAEAAPAPAADSGDGDGIKVHGHWTIEVRNPDGTLDDRYEFENALLPGGGRYLIRALAGEVIESRSWNVALKNGVNSGPCGGACLIGQVWQGGINLDSDDLAFVADIATGIFQLNGSVVVIDDGEIEVVSTSVIIDNQPDNISNRAGFTAKTLDTPIAVVAGQEVEITVEISFS